MQLAFVGLGVMGYPMAGHLKNAGHAVTVYNRTAARASRWCDQFGGVSAATPAAAAKDAEIVFCCVGNDDDVRSVVFGPTGILAGIAAGSTIVDHTTASAVVAVEVFEAAAQQGVGFLDAPLSGGQAGAENGLLTVMAGGDEKAFAGALPAMQSYAKTVTLIGAVGSGQRAKMVNQICIAGIVQGLSEALHFAKQANLDVAKVFQAVSKGAAQSWQMENRWDSMVDGEFEFGFAVEWMRKDLNIALEEAQMRGTSLEMTKLVDSFYAEVQQMGGGRWDTSSLIARLEKPS